jgi:hypothetical protein
MICPPNLLPRPPPHHRCHHGTPGSGAGTPPAMFLHLPRESSGTRRPASAMPPPPPSPATAAASLRRSGQLLQAALPPREGCRRRCRCQTPPVGTSPPPLSCWKGLRLHWHGLPAPQSPPLMPLPPPPPPPLPGWDCPDALMPWPGPGIRESTHAHPQRQRR